MNAVFECRTRLRFVPVTFVDKGTDQGFDIVIIFALYENVRLKILILQKLIFFVQEKEVLTATKYA